LVLPLKIVDALTVPFEASAGMRDEMCTRIHCQENPKLTIAKVEFLP
jgi:hypothetical protein